MKKINIYEICKNRNNYIICIYLYCLNYHIKILYNKSLFFLLFIKI